MNRKFLRVLCVSSVATFAMPSLAAEFIKLNCPTGTKQSDSSSSKGADMVACIKTDVKGFVPHGPVVLLYPDGTKQAEGSAEDGSRTGLWTFYTKQGRKTGTAMFKRGSFDGDVVKLHDNGRVKSVEQYADGLREGMTKEYSEDGALLKQTEYRNNREVSVK